MKKGNEGNEGKKPTDGFFSNIRSSDSKAPRQLSEVAPGSLPQNVEEESTKSSSRFDNFANNFANAVKGKINTVKEQAKVEETISVPRAQLAGLNDALRNLMKENQELILKNAELVRENEKLVKELEKRPTIEEATEVVLELSTSQQVENSNSIAVVSSNPPNAANMMSAPPPPPPLPPVHKAPEIVIKKRGVNTTPVAPPALEGRSALMAAIANGNAGENLRKAEEKPVAPPALEGRAALMAEIANGNARANLKKAEDRTLPEKKETQKQAGISLFSITAALARKMEERRRAIEPGSDSESSDSEWGEPQKVNKGNAISQPKSSIQPESSKSFRRIGKKVVNANRLRLTQAQEDAQRASEQISKLCGLDSERQSPEQRIESPNARELPGNLGIAPAPETSAQPTEERRHSVADRVAAFQNQGKGKGGRS